MRCRKNTYLQTVHTPTTPLSHFYRVLSVTTIFYDRSFTPQFYHSFVHSFILIHYPTLTTTKHSLCVSHLLSLLHYLAVPPMLFPLQTPTLDNISANFAILFRPLTTSTEQNHRHQQRCSAERTCSLSRATREQTGDRT